MRSMPADWPAGRGRCPRGGDGGGTLGALRRVTASLQPQCD